MLNHLLAQRAIQKPKINPSIWHENSGKFLTPDKELELYAHLLNVPEATHYAAMKLINSGVGLYNEGRFVEALSVFNACLSYFNYLELDYFDYETPAHEPISRTLLYKSFALEKLERYKEALIAYGVCFRNYSYNGSLVAGNKAQTAFVNHNRLIKQLHLSK